MFYPHRIDGPSHGRKWTPEPAESCVVCITIKKEGFMPGCCVVTYVCVYLCWLSGKETKAHWKASDMLSWKTFKIYCQHHVNSEKRKRWRSQCCVVVIWVWADDWALYLSNVMVHPHTQKHWSDVHTFLFSAKHQIFAVFHHLNSCALEDMVCSKQFVSLLLQTHAHSSAAFFLATPRQTPSLNKWITLNEPITKSRCFYHWSATGPFWAAFNAFLLVTL